MFPRRVAVDVDAVLPSTGEVVVQRVEGVLRYAPHTKFRHGVSGSLICTNFKVGFVDSGEVRWALTSDIIILIFIHAQNTPNNA